MVDAKIIYIYIEPNINSLICFELIFFYLNDLKNFKLRKSIVQLTDSLFIACF